MRVPKLTVLLLLIRLAELAVLTHNSRPRNDGAQITLSLLFAHLVELYGFESATIIMIIYGAELFFANPRSLLVAILCVYHS